MAKDHDVALRLVQGHEVGRRRELLVKQPAHGEGDVDQVGEQLRAEQRPHAPQPQGGRPLGAFHGPQAAVELGQSRRGRIEQVGAVLAEGLEAVGRLAIEDEGAQRRHEQHLVGVPDQAVGAVQAGHQVPIAGAEAGRPAVGRIDVQPHAVAAADVGHLSNGSKAPTGVEHAQATTATIGRPGRWSRPASRPAAATIHAAPRVEPHADHVARAQAQDARRARHAVMGVGVDHQHRRRARPGRALLPAIAPASRCGR